jgi:hypothetical protein
MLYLDLILGVALIGLGFWGYRGAEGLVSDVSDAEAKRKKERGIRRGSVLTMIIGTVMAVGSLWRFAWSIFG